ncbi:macro domain-containing protein [Chloroflexota bacterium]
MKIKGLTTGITNHPWRWFSYIFLAFSVMWTLTEGITYFIPSIDIRGISSLIVILIISLIFSVVKIWQPSKIRIPVKHTNTTIEILFGDLFAESGYRAIGVGEFFDSELGKPVSENSLHGILIKKVFGGRPEVFDKIIEDELKNVGFEVVKRSEGKTKKYPIGTAAVIPFNNDNYICFASCHTEIETSKSFSDVSTLWDALHGLWKKAKVSVGGDCLVLPLVGSALAGVGLPTKELLHLIVLSIISGTKLHKHITSCIRIVLTEDKFDEIDLRELERYWS